MEKLVSALANNYLLYNESSKYFNKPMKELVELSNNNWEPTALLWVYYYVKKGDNTEERLSARSNKIGDHKISADNEYQKELTDNPWVLCGIYHADNYSILERWFNETLEKWYRIEVFRDGVIREYSFGYASKVANQHNPIEIRENTWKNILPILLEP